MRRLLAGIAALQRLTDRKLATIFLEDRDEPVSDDFPAEKFTAGAIARFSNTSGHVSDPG